MVDVTSPAWQNMPVFIGSTFRDLDDERDLLTRIVIPVVNARLREQGFNASVYPVDLRWGVDAEDHLDPQDRQRQILSICVSEVRRCRPLFIGLLGDRYGWVPPADLARLALAEAGLPDPGLPLSVTLLEMLAAVHTPDEEPPILLTRRASLGDRLAAAEARGGDPQGDRAALDRLEQYFAALGHPFRPYAARWLPAGRADPNEFVEVDRFDSPEFVQLATEALFAAVTRHVRRATPQSWLEEELNFQLLTAREEARQLVGRSDELEYVARHWDILNFLDYPFTGDNPRNPLWRVLVRKDRSTIAVLGESGSGKSALLAKVAMDLEIPDLADRPLTRRAYVSAGLTAVSERLPVCILLLLAQLEPNAAREIAARHSPETLSLDDVIGAWRTALNAASYLDPVLIVFDALDQIVSGVAETTPMNWLPTTLGDRVRVVISAIDDSFEGVMFRRRPDTHVLELGALPPADAETLVRSRIAARHRTLPAAALTPLLARPRSARWLVVATDLLLTLMAHDYLALRDAPAGSDGAVALRRLLADVAADLPPGLDDLHLTAMERLIELLGPRFAVPLCILGVTPVGVDQATLRATLDVCRVPFSDADLALFRDVFSSHVHLHHGEWRFRHSSAKAAVDRLLDDASDVFNVGMARSYRESVAAHLVSLPSDHPMRVRYLPSMLYLNGHGGALVEYISREDLCTDESLVVFIATLAGLFRIVDDPSAEVQALTAAARSDRQRLTVVTLLTTLLAALRRDTALRARAELQSALSTIDPSTQSRLGLKPDELARQMAMALPDLREVTSNPLALWLQNAIAEGRGDLSQAPNIVWTGSIVDRTSTANVTLSLLCEYAFAAAAGVLTPAPTDADHLRARLDAYYHLLRELEPQRAFEAPGPVPRPDVSYLSLLLATTERAADIVWPGGRFRPVADDFEQLQTVTDRTRGLQDFVVLLARNARCHSIPLMLTFADMEQAGPEDAANAATALAYLSEAQWQLDLQLALTPDAIAAQISAVQVGAAQMAILSAFEQHGSACAIGLATLTLPHATDIGPAEFMHLASLALTSFIESHRVIDPTALIDRVAAELDYRRPDELVSALGPEAPVMLSYLLFGASMYALGRGFDATAIRIAQRTLSMIRMGTLPEFPDMSAPELVRETIARLEKELVEAVQEWTDEEEFTPEDIDELARLCRTLDELRTLLIRHDGGQVADRVGLCLSTALRVGLLGEPAAESEVAQARGLVGVQTADEHLTSLIWAINVALSQPRPVLP